MHQETFLLFSSERSEFIDKFVDGEHFPFPAETHHLHEFLLVVNRFVGFVQHAEGSQPATGCHVSDFCVRERIVVMISSACSVTSRNNVFG